MKQAGIVGGERLVQAEALAHLPRVRSVDGERVLENLALRIALNDRCGIDAARQKIRQSEHIRVCNRRGLRSYVLRGQLGDTRRGVRRYVVRIPRSLRAVEVKCSTLTALVEIVDLGLTELTAEAGLV